MDWPAYVYISTVLIILVGLSLIIRVTCREEKEAARHRRNRRNNPTRNNIEFIDCSQADQRINNISSSVPGQNPPHYPDAYLSVEHIMVANELNKSPKYNEAPPSYEEAMKLAMAHSNSIQTYQAEQAQSGQQLEATSATTSTTPIAVTHQPSAVPNERF